MINTSSMPASDDPLIDEVRAIRRAISEQYDNDVDRLCAHLRELEREHADWTVVVPASATMNSDANR